MYAKDIIAANMIASLTPLCLDILVRNSTAKNILAKKIPRPNAIIIKYCYLTPDLSCVARLPAALAAVLSHFPFPKGRSASCDMPATATCYVATCSISLLYIRLRHSLES